MQNIFKNIDWVKKKGTTGQVELCPNFLEEKKFSFSRAISKFTSEYDTPVDLVPNLDQTSIFMLHRVNTHFI